MDQDFKYDVYISYAMPDVEWCDVLGRRLQQAGLRVWFDRWELRAGDSIQSRLAEARSAARTRLAILSRSYFAGKTSGPEAELFIEEHAADRTTHPLIPLLIEDLDIPPKYRDLIYIDFRDPEQFEPNFNTLLAQLDKGEGVPPPVRPKRVWLDLIDATPDQVLPEQLWKRITLSGVKDKDHVLLVSDLKDHPDPAHQSARWFFHGIYRVESTEPENAAILAVELHFQSQPVLDDQVIAKIERGFAEAKEFAETLEEESGALQDLESTGLLKKLAALLVESNIKQANQIRTLLLQKQPPIATHLHSDMWTLEDRLGYSLYAKAIAEFIFHKQTSAPLTIGVFAPWGYGKTTFMRLVESHLKLKAKQISENPQASEAEKEGSTASAVQASNPPPSIQTEKSTKVWNRNLFRSIWNKIRTGDSSPSPAIPPRATFAHLQRWLESASSHPTQLTYPTVWFNAWKFQNSEQVWAGMAQTIISQLVEQIPSTLEREKFWLQLQRERLNFDAIRRDIHRALFERFLPKALKWLVSFFLALLLLVVSLFVANLLNFWAGLMLFSAASLTATLSAAKTIWKWSDARLEVLSKPLEGKFAQYIRQPDYEAKLGYLFEVERDVRRVFDLLVAKDRRAVIFVDDLDRCSPGKVAEVIEAINLFISGDFPQCYFVIGMDAQVVASSLEVAYKDLTAKLGDLTRAYGSLGWYFMDKFVQLPFVIPNMNSSQRETFLSLLFVQSAPKTMDDDTRAAVEAAEQRLHGGLTNNLIVSQNLGRYTDDFKIIRKADPTKANDYAYRLIEVGARQFADDDAEIQQQLVRYASYLGSTPRGLKRFANLYRFYRFAQWSREFQDLKAATPAALGFWLVIMLRWPQMVRWIQWDGETQVFAASSPLEKAEKFQRLIAETANYNGWMLKLTTEKMDQIGWTKDQQLFDFVKSQQDDSNLLTDAVEMGIW
ncbi:MAG TPA: P-loop NTPase fold protein [Pyrinomonadaceae bacterium]|nr:P-loop NTPase fold protein [Pyrinomonadaceae bacterium]